MCVFICVNPKVQERLELPLAIAHRQAMQLCALCPIESQLLPATPHTPLATTLVKPLDEQSERRIMKRGAWLQAYYQSRTRAAARRTSTQDWHKAFDAIAEAWGRLLSLVGLRW